MYKQALYKMNLSEQDIDRIVQMACEAIAAQFGLPEKEVIALMRSHLKRSSFEMWRKRMNGRSTKHQALRNDTIDRFHCSQQRSISLNKIAKR